MRIGCFGGSFNPIHSAHIRLADEVTRQFSLDLCILMVAGDPPHKLLHGNALSKDRLAMACIAAEESGNENIFVSDYEIKKQGTSYTVDTLTYLKSHYPDDELFLIMGADMLCSFSTWKNPEIITQLARLIAVRRPDMETDSAYTQAVNELREKFSAVVLETDISLPDISSTDIRSRIEKAMPISGLVPPGVEEYIYANGLYSTSNIHYITLDLQKRLSMKRFRHSISTMKQAIFLADRYDVDREKCKTAALIHDCEKINGADAYLLAQRYGVELDEAETESPGLIHAKLGAHMAQIRYGIKDREILDAVAYHTTGAPYMTHVAMVTYLADCTEETRSYPDLEAIREATMQSLELGMLKSFECTERNLAAQGKVIHPRSLAAKEWILSTMRQ